MNSSRFLVGITMTSGTFDHRSGTHKLRNDKRTSDYDHLHKSRNIPTAFGACVHAGKQASMHKSI